MPVEPLAVPFPEPPAPPPPVRRRPRFIHAALFLATVISTMYFGSGHYAGFMADFTREAPSVSFLDGAWYSLTILAILGVHEMGHYLACRYYRIDASLPYFLPAPFVTGTVGAFIRIRDRIPTKPILFDVGAAGPIAGFVVAVPALFLGIALSRVTPLPDDGAGLLTLGEPLLFQGAAWLIWGPIPEGYAINLHPTGFAAWFGLLATALNLFPIGQLDGGHIAYAALGSRSTTVTLGGVAVVIALTFVSASWIVWAMLMVVMLILAGPRHPRTLDEHVPLDPARRRVALAAAAIFVVCFTPTPIEFGG